MGFYKQITCCCGCCCYWCFFLSLSFSRHFVVYHNKHTDKYKHVQTLYPLWRFHFVRFLYRPCFDYKNKLNAKKKNVRWIIALGIRQIIINMIKCFFFIQSWCYLHREEQRKNVEQKQWTENAQADTEDVIFLSLSHTHSHFRIKK